VSDVSYMICEISVCEMNDVLSFDCECGGMSVIPADKTVFVWKLK